ncbi:MAG: hypothetical protein ABGY09_03565, partial [Euryarchaeota archaeon]
MRFEVVLPPVIAVVVLSSAAHAAGATGARLAVDWKLQAQLILDDSYRFSPVASKYVDPEVASREGYYYQIKGPAMATDGNTVLVAWEYWGNQSVINGKVEWQGVYGIALKAVDSTTSTSMTSTYVLKRNGYIMFGPALVSYDRGKFLLAVPEVNANSYMAGADYGELWVYKVTVDAQNKRVNVDTQNALKVADNAAYPHLVYLGEDKNGNRYVAVVYEAWNPSSGKGDVALQVLKIDASGKLDKMFSSPVTIAQGVCKDHVEGSEHYFGHARPVASLYEEGGKKYLIVALTDYSQASPYVSQWGWFNEWWGCKVRAFVIELPSDLSALNSAKLTPVEVQGQLTALGAVDTTAGSNPVKKPPTNEAPWVADNVIVYRAGPLWGGMNTVVPDVYAALIVHENGRWVFKSDRCICGLVY